MAKPERQRPSCILQLTSFHFLRKKDWLMQLFQTVKKKKNLFGLDTLYYKKRTMQTKTAITAFAPSSKRHQRSTEVSCSIFYQLNIIGIKDHLRLRSSRLRKQPLERGFVWDPFFCLVDLQQHPNLLLFLSVPHLLR